MGPIVDLSKEWEQVFKKYAFIKKLGQGSFGTVIKAKNIQTGQKVAIKLIKCLDHQYSVRKVFREIKLMRKLSEIQNNIFTTKVIDVILPENLQNVTKETKLNSKIVSELSHIFIVMNFGISDLKNLLGKVPQTYFSEDHAIIILYNMLCGLKFLHSAGVVHRDIKPGNILIDGSCNIMFCDFGLARTLPKVDKELQFRDPGQSKEQVLKNIQSKKDLLNK